MAITLQMQTYQRVTVVVVLTADVDMTLLSALKQAILYLLVRPNSSLTTEPVCHAFSPHSHTDKRGEAS